VTFTEFVNFVLTRLYELDGQASTWVGVDVEKLAEELPEPVPSRWPLDAVDVLRARGLASAGDVDQVVGASISGEGRLHVEREGLIEQYGRGSTNIVYVTGSGNTVAVDVDGSVTQGPSAREHQTTAEPGPTQDDPYAHLLVRAGLTNPLVGRHQISGFARPLEHDEKGSVIRVVLGATAEGQARELVTGTKEKLREAIRDSWLEGWFIAEGHGLLRERPMWRKDRPNNGYTTTLIREPVANVGEGSILRGKCTLQLPVGLTSGPYVLIIIEVIEQAAEGADPRRRMAYTLGSLYSLLHTLAWTVIDDLGRAVFPLIFDWKAPSLVGPNFEIDFGDRALTEMILLPSHYERPAGAQDSPWANINTPVGTPLDDRQSLDAVIRTGLVSILRQNEFDGMEDDIAGLPYSERGRP
jgi:hypothetical protein